MINNTSFSVGVIISTYNNPAWLEKTLWGYTSQTRPADEIVIADDGSGAETKALIDSFRDKLPIKHIWHEDHGFQKSEILNNALLAAKSEYLIFTDQDCIPRADFVETHLRFAESGYFLSGGYFKLTMDVSTLITKDDVRAAKPFSINWLRENGMSLSFKMAKLVKSTFVEKILNTLTPARATWNGCNSSGWKSDMLAVNGFNEDMHYGGQDRECGERLKNMGIKAKQIRFSALVLHLDHKRPYKTKESMEFNRNVIANTKKNKTVKTPNGIEKLSD